MTYTPSTPRNRAALDRKSSALMGLFFAGMIFVAPPALAQDNPNDPGPEPGCSPSGQTPQKCDEGIPVPLAAAGIPALLALGGGFIAIRKRRRDSKIKK